MPVRKRGNKWHYEFMKSGKRYSGVCEGCNTQAQAEKYLNTIKEKQGAVAAVRNVEQLYEKKHEELTGNAGIALADAFAESLKYSTRNIAAARQELKSRIFADFVAFMAAKFPEIKNISEVGINHANQYTAYLIKFGRFNNDVTYTRNGQQIFTSYTDRKLSNNTINYYVNVCAEVFEKLKFDAGIIHNPFTQKKRLPKQEEGREVFTEAEVKRIYDNLSDFVKPLFIVAFNTGMREGDICTLKWENISFAENKIRRKQNKTKNYVEIPILPELREFLAAWQVELINKTEDAKQSTYKNYRLRWKYLNMSAADFEKYADYVFPEHAKMYLENQTGVSYRIKEFLESIGIKTTRTPEGRTRAVSIKDLHSCRHTVAKRFADAGVSLVTAQSILGHMSPEMTKHYMAHTTYEDKQKAMAAISNTDTRRLELINKLSALPTATLEKLLKRL